MNQQLVPVWAVAVHGLCDGWSIGTLIEGDRTYADVYATATEAEQDLADDIRERLTQFIDDAESYGDLATALDSGFQVIEATLRADGAVIVDREVVGTASPAFTAAVTASSTQ